MNLNLYEVFRFFNNSKVFSINEIEWWLLKYSDFYKSTYDFVQRQHIFKTDNGSIVRLPPLGKLTDKEKFLELYKALDTISEFHRNEKYFEQELTEYQKIKNSQSDLKKWVVKNQDLGADKYVCFLVDYLDYSENAEHLNIYIRSSKEIEIYVDRQDFRNTIEFLEKFNELYWIDENITKTEIK